MLWWQWLLVALLIFSGLFFILMLLLLFSSLKVPPPSVDVCPHCGSKKLFVKKEFIPIGRDDDLREEIEYRTYCGDCKRSII